MRSNFRWCALVLAVLPVTLGMQGGCPGGGPPRPDFSSLAGLWQITRGQVRLTLAGGATDGGDWQGGSSSGELLPIDLDSVAPLWRPLAEQWNQHLANLNASLDAAFPARVIIAFPRFATMRLTDAADPTRTIEGLINNQAQYLFAGDLSGGGQGSDQGGGFGLSIATIEGSFNVEARTTSGRVARTLILVVAGPQGAVGLSIQISVDYTGQRIGDPPPATQPAAGQSG